MSRGAPEGADTIAIKEAAALLGVSEMTLRRWDRSGKFRAHRHPLNNYRVYRRAEVLALRGRIDGPPERPTARRPKKVRLTERGFRPA